MKILAFTDIHADPHAFKILKMKAEKEKPDLLVCCGDISNFGMDIDIAVKKILELKLKTLLIPGNHESVNEVKLVAQKNSSIINLHNDFFKFKEFVFYGYGTGGFSMHDEKFERLVPKIISKIPKGKKLIFITHAPFYNTKLDKLGSSHHGNKSTRVFVERVKPILSLCGHFHENEKKEDKIKGCRVLNPGNDGMIINL